MDPDRPTTDPVWHAVLCEARMDEQSEPMLASFLHDSILRHQRLEDALSFILANKLDTPVISAISVREVIEEALQRDPSIGEAVRADIQAIVDRDPACRGYSAPLLYLKGFHALQSHRVAHWLWKHARRPLALYLQSRVSEIFAADIHPGAQIGKGILIDHATSVVIGETAVVGDNVSILHEVTLGGTGKQTGDRHPKVGEGVLIAAGAKLLGNIRIGEGAKIGAGSVVLDDVEPHTTIVGVPGRPVGKARFPKPALEMDHHINSGDSGDSTPGG
jgi:serine O-acetyltransferase